MTLTWPPSAATAATSAPGSTSQQVRRVLGCATCSRCVLLLRVGLLRTSHSRSSPGRINTSLLAPLLLLLPLLLCRKRRVPQPEVWSVATGHFCLTAWQHRGAQHTSRSGGRCKRSGHGQSHAAACLCNLQELHPDSCWSTFRPA